MISVSIFYGMLTLIIFLFPVMSNLILNSTFVDNKFPLII